MGSPRNIAIITGLVLLAGFALVELGGRLTYMYSSDATYLRLAIFALLSAMTFYLVFIRKMKPGNTVAQQLTEQMLPKNKAIWALKYVLSTLAFFLAMAWMTIGLAPWGARLAPGLNVSYDYKVEELKRRGSTMFLVSLRGSNGDRRWLQIPDVDLSRAIRPGESVCISGKSSLFGVLVHKVEHSRCAKVTDTKQGRNGGQKRGQVHLLLKEAF